MQIYNYSNLIPMYTEQGDPFLEELKENGLALARFPLFIKKSKEHIKQAVVQNGLSLEFASEEWRNDPEIVFLACLNNPKAFYFASPSLKQSEAFINCLILDVDVKCIAYANPVFLTEEKYVKKLIKLNAAIYPYLSSWLTSLISFNIAAVQINPKVYDFLADEYTSNPAFLNLICFKDTDIHFEIFDFVISKFPTEILDLITKTPEILKSWGSPYDENPALADYVCQLNIKNLAYVSLDLRNNLHFMLYHILYKDPEAFRFAGDFLQDHDELSLLAVTQLGMQIEYCSSRIRKSSFIHAYLACDQNPAAYLLCDESFQKDPEIAARAFVKDHFLLDVIHKEVFISPKFWAHVLSIKPDYMQFCPNECVTSLVFWEEIVEINPALSPFN